MLFQVILFVLTKTSCRYDNDSQVPEGGYAPNETYVPWMITYWSTFLLAWLILPLFRESLLSGQFTFCTRLSFGCKKAIRGYILLLLIAVSSVLFLVFQLHSWHVVPVLMALGNTYGLLLVSLLLGYGLVNIPQKVWRQANPAQELRRTQIMAGNSDEALYEAVWELQDCEALIDAAAAKIGDYQENGNRVPMDMNYSYCLDKLLTLRKSTAVLDPELQRRRTGGQHRRHHERVRSSDEDDDDDDSSQYNEESMPSLDYLASLNARLQAAQAAVISEDQRWNELVKKSLLYKDLVENTVPRPTRTVVESDASCLAKLMGTCRSVGDHLRYIWLVYLRGPWFRVAGVASAVLSVMVLWSEATLAAAINLSPFALILRAFDGHRGFLFQLAAMIPLLYMSLCVYGSLFKFSLFGRYRLRGSKQSQGVALIFNAQYLVRLQFPLGYNYLFMYVCVVHVDVLLANGLSHTCLLLRYCNNRIKYDTSATNCAFSHVMSNMSTVPFLGTSFSVYAPLLILALCAFTMCNGYARLLAVLGVEHEDAILLADHETLDSKVNEGITLLRRHSDRQDLLTKEESTSKTSKDASDGGIV